MHDRGDARTGKADRNSRAIGCDPEKIVRRDDGAEPNLLQAALDEFLALRADDPLIDRLLEAVKVGLRHAQLHLIVSFLSLDCL